MLGRENAEYCNASAAAAVATVVVWGNGTWWRRGAGRVTCKGRNNRFWVSLDGRHQPTSEQQQQQQHVSYVREISVHFGDS